MIEGFWLWLSFGLLAATTLITRGSFIMAGEKGRLPAVLQRALRYAPAAALAALVAPELVLTRGELVASWHDAKLVGAVTAVGWMLWRRDMLGTIVVGTATMLICRLGFGW